MRSTTLDVNDATLTDITAEAGWGGPAATDDSTVGIRGLRAAKPESNGLTVKPGAFVDAVDVDISGSACDSVHVEGARLTLRSSAVIRSRTTGIAAPEFATAGADP